LSNILFVEIINNEIFQMPWIESAHFRNMLGETIRIPLWRIHLFSSIFFTVVFTVIFFAKEGYFWKFFVFIVNISGVFLFFQHDWNIFLAHVIFSIAAVCVFLYSFIDKKVM